MEITLQHTGGSRFVAEARQHRVVMDQPVEDGSSDHGMTPAELLLISLGGCVGQYVTQYLQMRGLPSEGLSIRVEAQPVSRPLRLTEFGVEVIVPGLTERQLNALQKTFPAGLVQRTLAQENKLRFTAAPVGGGEAELSAQSPNPRSASPRKN